VLSACVFSCKLLALANCPLQQKRATAALMRRTVAALVPVLAAVLLGG